MWVESTSQDEERRKKFHVYLSWSNMDLKFWNWIFTVKKIYSFFFVWVTKIEIRRKLFDMVSTSCTTKLPSDLHHQTATAIQYCSGWRMQIFHWGDDLKQTLAFDCFRLPAFLPGTDMQLLGLRFLVDSRVYNTTHIWCSRNRPSIKTVFLFCETQP